MTKKEIRSRVAYWQSILGLERWKIDVDFYKEPQGFFAEVQRSPQYEIATIKFTPGWETQDPKALDQVILMVALHVLMRDLDAVSEATLVSLHPDTAKQVEKRYEHEAEAFVDMLAFRIAEMME